MHDAKGAGVPFISLGKPNYTDPDLLISEGVAGEAVEVPAAPGAVAGAAAEAGSASATAPQEGAGVFVAARDLAGSPIGKHQYVVLVPEDPSQFEDAGDFAPRDLGDGTMGIVIGAHNVEQNGQDMLVANPFEASDLEATQEHYDPSRISMFERDWDTEVHQVDLGAIEGSNDDAIRSIIAATENYNNQPLPYGYPYPWASEEARNSNSWAQSVIEHTIGPDRVEENFDGADVFHDRRIGEDRFEPAPSEPEPGRDD